MAWPLRFSAWRPQLWTRQMNPIKHLEGCNSKLFQCAGSNEESWYQFPSRDSRRLPFLWNHLWGCGSLNQVKDALRYQRDWFTCIYIRFKRGGGYWGCLTLLSTILSRCPQERRFDLQSPSQGYPVYRCAFHWDSRGNHVKAPEAYLKTLMRRFMMRITDRIREVRNGLVIYQWENYGRTTNSWKYAG